jgi:hypothetical protein
MYPSFFDELVKIAEEDTKERVMQGFVKSRPYVAGAIKTGLPAALVAKTVLDKPWVTRAALLGGAGLGVANEAIKRWAQKHPRGSLAKEIKKQGSVIRKVAAMATDLRRTGIGGVKRPPFPTEDSKQQAFQTFQNAQQPGKFTTHTQAKHLRGPGASIPQIAPLPR